MVQTMIYYRQLKHNKNLIGGIKLKRKNLVLIVFIMVAALLIGGCSKQTETPPKDTDGSLSAEANTEDTNVEVDTSVEVDIDTDTEEDLEDLEDFEMVLGDKAKITKEEIEDLYKTDKNMLMFFDTFSGRLAPDFEMEGLDGKKINLSDFKGQNVVIEFMGSWCEVCVSSVPNNEKFNEEYKDAKIISIGVNETIENLKDFAKASGVDNIEYYIPTSDETVEDYEIFFVPIYFYIDSEGYVQMILAGDAPVDVLKEYANKSFK